MEVQWHVYLLRCDDDTLYCGITLDPERRLKQHNGTLPGGAKYTAGRRPAVMAACMPCVDKRSAASLEYRIKRMTRSQKLAFFGVAD